jgi:pimeloyl-ACP methyl ester carboxylesterase
MLRVASGEQCVYGPRSGPRLDILLLLGKLGIIVLAMLCSGVSIAGDIPQFRFSQSTGPYSVGFRVVEQYDYSRAFHLALDSLGKPYQGERARPMQTLIWYPAERSDRFPMTVKDYSHLWTTEISFGEPKMPDSARLWLLGMGPELRDSMWAVRDSNAIQGHFPVIIYSPSLYSIATPWENADLCEYLASNGYVVVAGPNLGPLSPGMAEDITGVEAQARDISFLIGYAHTLPNVDPHGSAVAVIGFSWGGIASLFAAAKDSRIAALVSLDGSMRYFPGLVRAGDIHPGLLTIPHLYFQQSNMSLEDEEKEVPESDRLGPSVLNAWTHGDLLTVRMLGLTHQEFASMYQRNEFVWNRFFDRKAAGQRPGDYDRADGIVGYAWVCRYTLAFLDAYVKHDRGAMTFLRNTPAQNNVPQHVLWPTYRAASSVPPSIYGFRTRVAEEGFDHAAQIYASIKQQIPSFSLDDTEFDIWAEELMADGHLSEAITLLKLNVTLHPDSSDGYADLGDAYRLSGDAWHASENYKSALERDPGMQRVRDQLGWSGTGER